MSDATTPSRAVVRGVETGDREAFITNLRQRTSATPFDNIAHPLPPPVDGVPLVRSTKLDANDLIGSFVRNAEAARVVVHQVEGSTVPDDLVADIVARRAVARAVVSREPEAQAVGTQLAGLRVQVDAISKDACAQAELGVTSAIAAFATTGTLVQHSGRAGGRTASLLPPNHLCVLPASRIVASTADVVRTLGTGATGELPSNIVFITGPSRSGDIEQIIALGVHGPLSVEVVLLLGA